MKRNSKNNAFIYVVILIILIIIGLYLKFWKSTAPAVLETPQEETETTANPILIGSKDIKEENFTGKVATVSGDSVLAQKAQAYINQSVADFKKTADTDVPAMRKQFGADSPTAQYEIDIDAKYVKGEKAESVVMLAYTYTGGAHGSSIYKVLTASVADGKILSLSDVIKSDKKNAFTEFVKKELKAWRPYGSSGASPVFPEDVQALNFDSFTNWSLDNNNLIIYFSQYEIGPGVLGVVPFSISRAKVKSFLNSSY